jgi:glycosyltransferase involved in cell wall biosynthesis
MIFYLTYNDLPSGIFSSQVIDVVKYIKDNFDVKIKLVSFISLRRFKENKLKIKQELPEAIVVPMFPGVRRWKQNYFLLSYLIYRNNVHTIIGRSLFAASLALYAKKKTKVKKVIYDGRGAIAEEWKEYNVGGGSITINEIESLERDCVMHTDFRISVSKQLIQYWIKTYNYNIKEHVVIPCTLNFIYENVDLTRQNISHVRNKIGFCDTDVVLVYSGSISGWQSFDLLCNFLKQNINQNENIKILFLSDLDNNIQKLLDEFPSKIQYLKVLPHEVPNYLIAADYGLLIREESITNKVASPVKFAEYLACGLKVLISQNLGDYSEFILHNKCGEIYNNILLLKNVSNENKIYNRSLALKCFTKKSFFDSYRLLLHSLNKIA